MKRITSIILGLVCIPLLLLAQPESNDYSMVELSYMKVKHGHYQQFEDAVKVHNDKYHKEGEKYEADLFTIVTGKNAGWYVWAMVGVTFTDLDSRPAEGEHDMEWEENVAPHVEKYGPVEYWRLSSELSNTMGNQSPMINLWLMDIKQGEYYRFRSFMENVKKVHIEMDSEIEVYYNQFGGSDGRDVSMVFPLENWAKFDEDDWKMKEEYEKLFGEGTWEYGMDEWEDFTESTDRVIWKRLDD